MYKKALISVSDKTGLEEFLKPLVKKGLELVSTGGTAQFLKSKNFKVQEVQNLTSFPEVLSGRVKTLHPFIFMPLLARKEVKKDQDVLENYKIQAFDLLVVNLYPFETKAIELTDKEKVEWIDVGGPSLLRAGAKNYSQVTTVCDPKDYLKVQKGTDIQIRKQLAVKVFQKLSEYDSVIANNLNKDKNSKLKEFKLKGRFFKKLRYGENPHQKADWFKTRDTGLHSVKIIQGKELSYNNILDFETALQAVKDFKEPCVVAVKHNNPCGIALGDKISNSLKKTLSADSVSVFGAVLAFNQKLDIDCAKQLKDIFLEGLIAPQFSKAGLDILKDKKNLRILEWPEMLCSSSNSSSLKEVMGGFLLQSKDKVSHIWSKNWQIIGPPPSNTIKKDLLFSWKLCSHLKSNAIAVIKNRQSLGLGMGQVNRVDSVRLALMRKDKFHSHHKKDLILASDAFFPFPDSIELAYKGGVRWIIQPGGSIKDREILEKSSELNLTMILTNQRHFKH
ncbi:MAG: bifunctional phosphoribosylaminoimidazolecarboxamide formyltransferase/IMP cyclohydrolase [Bdellovibrionaceae bacterium]|nr:bifunctional phosphoribosylaminoimidazolecarboxamide formyltransferase/IMP cyclohydrolase [Pseudobdellovibrionaceae bacterium]